MYPSFLFETVASSVVSALLRYSSILRQIRHSRSLPAEVDRAHWIEISRGSEQYIVLLVERPNLFPLAKCASPYTAVGPAFSLNIDTLRSSCGIRFCVWLEPGIVGIYVMTSRKILSCDAKPIPNTNLPSRKLKLVTTPVYLHRSNFGYAPFNKN